MSKTKAGKGIRLFKVSKELNLARDTLLQHLKDEGHEVVDAGPNAVLSEAMYEELLQHFAKDKEAASRHERKVQEIRSRKEEDEVEEEVPVVGEEDVATEGIGEVEDSQEEISVAEEHSRVGEDERDRDADVVPDQSMAERIVGDGQETVPPEAPDLVVDEAGSPAGETVSETEEDEPAATAEDGSGDDDRTAAEAATEADETVPVDDHETETEADAAEEVTAASEADDTVADEEVTASESRQEEIEGRIEAAGEEIPEVFDDPTIQANRYRLTGPKVIGKVDISGFKEEDKPKRKRKRKRKAKEGEGDEKVVAVADKGVKPREKTAKEKEDEAARSRKKRKRRRTPAVDESEVEQAIIETRREMEKGGGKARQRRRRARREERAAERQRDMEEQEKQSTVLKIIEYTPANEVANLMNVPVTSVIQTCMEMGMMVSINQRLDADTITLIADEFGYDVEFITDIGAEDLEIEEDDPEKAIPRAPVVTIMGHVDHGKTSLLDYIRKANVVSGEAGGITQHIGAYEVELPDSRQITFLDTPGHEAFTAMRARGAQVTDVVILVVAADDSVMPQTREAINHAKAAGVPIIVAINKIDRPSSNPQKIMQQLSEQNVLVEQYGGNVQCGLVSAHTGEGVLELLEKVVLEAELLNLTADPDREAVGAVIESKLDKGRGVVATVLVQTGTLQVGDIFVAGLYNGRVRAMFDERDKRVETAGPSRPALVLGFNGSPEVGDTFVVMPDEREARDLAHKRQQIHREQSIRQRKHITLDDIGRRLALGEFQELNLIVKADVGGSVEALSDSLLKLSTEEVQVNIIHSGVGAITESDVMLASASDAVIIGFQVRPTTGVRKIAEQEEIDVRLYSIIYDAIADLRDALEGMLSPETSDNILGLVEVRELFRVPRIGTVAGCQVLEGKIRRSDKIRLIRDGVVIYDGKLASLKRFKDDVREVSTGYECGLSIENYNDIKVGDHVEAYELVETRRKLEV